MHVHITSEQLPIQLGSMGADVTSRVPEPEIWLRFLQASSSTSQVNELLLQITMRLINIEKMILEVFFGHQIPPYAILSHTWGKEELSFQDIQKSGSRSKHGFAKIDFACRQAKLEGFRHAWIDTCCIDKSSSVELSEAINSMYSWYAKAAACYVYLEDVTVSAIFDETSSQFEKSRWFTRGWTLQELLAPQDVHFYDENWKSIGTKKKLCKLVSKITQIPELVLQDKMHLKSIGVAQRMSWAAKGRQHGLKI